MNNRKPIPTIGLWVLLALVCSLSRTFFDHTSSALAYDYETHKQIIIDAIDYMLIQPVDLPNPVHKSAERSDFALLWKTLVPDKKDSSAARVTIRSIAEDIGTYSGQTDELLDVKLRLKEGGRPEPNFGNIYFTMFSHFLNVNRDGMLWENGGYTYDWVKGSQCSSKYYKDIFANLFVDHGGSRYDSNASSSFLNYRPPLKKTVNDTDYKNHLSQDIRDISFWPITNLADYWHDEFQKVEKLDNGRPRRVQPLGPMLAI